MKFLTEPYLLSLHPSTEMYICWIQWAPADGIVEYGTTKQLGSFLTAKCHEIRGFRAPASENGYAPEPEANPSISLWQCIAKIDGLTPGEHIFYRCRIGEEATQIYDFHTAPPSGEPFRFAQVSDLQGLPDCHKTLYQIGCQKPDFLLYSGDAAFITWRLDCWFDTGESWQDAETAPRAFFPCMQQQNGARLMQYAPTFFCPGNHDMNDWRVDLDKELCRDDSKWNWSIFMQLFRPLYPDLDSSLSGRRWYSANYGDLHIISLSFQRCAVWSPYEAPGWRLIDSIAPDSPQIQWLTQDLASSDARFKWVIQHWHILNKGSDVQIPLCDPVIDPDGTVTYPEDHGAHLMDLFEKYGVNGVSYGHSHVYERYFTKGTHYIEAAYLSVCYREENAALHPSGLMPIIEDNSQRSFLIIERRTSGLFGTGYYATEEPEIFDEYQLADENGRSVEA